jgi:predicted lipoprotein
MTNKINIRFQYSATLGGTLLILATSLISACSPAPANRVLQDTTLRSIVPGYQQFAESSSQLSRAASQFCAAPVQNSEELSTLRDAWRHTALSWAAVQNLQFGPLLEDNQAWKIQFWPDKKNLIARKVESLLRSDSPLDREKIDKASVVVQGLSSLEYLLFDSSAGQIQRYQDKTSHRRCDMLTAVSQHLQGVASGLYDAWRSDDGDYTSHFTHTGKDNPEYPDDSVAMANLVDSLVAGVELIERDKLARPLGLDNDSGQAQVYLLEWWRSQYSKEMIIANLIALQTLFRAGDGYGLDDYLSGQKQHSDLSLAIDEGFVRAINSAHNQPGSLFIAATSPEHRPKLEALYSDIRTLANLLKNELPEALGISLGFNSKDGD